MLRYLRVLTVSCIDGVRRNRLVVRVAIDANEFCNVSKSNTYVPEGSARCQKVEIEGLRITILFIVLDLSY
jgi:hypothetical protein